MAPHDPDPTPGYDLEKLESDARFVHEGLFDKLRRTLGQVSFVVDALAAFYCAIDPKTPRWVQAVLFAALAYFILPLDVIPDFIVGLGYTDDASILIAALKAVQSHVRDRHRDRAHRYLDKARPPPTSSSI